MTREASDGNSLPRRIAWFVALWAAGVLAVTGLALLIRLLLP